MSDTPATTAALRALLLARSGDPPVAVAAALHDRAGAHAPEQLAELAADPELAPSLRAIALLGVAMGLADAPALPAPPGALDAVEDAATAAAAIELGMVGALTGVLRAAPLTPQLRTTRRLIGRRCLAAGVVGPHVARLLADGGDHEAAARAAADYLAPRLIAGRSSAETWACLHLLVEWSDLEAEPLFTQVIERLAPVDGAVNSLLQLLHRCPGLSAAQVSRTRAHIGWTIDPSGSGST